MTYAVSISAESAEEMNHARQLAGTYGVPFAPLGQTAIQLVITHAHAEIRAPVLGKPILIDFSRGKYAHRRQFGGGRGQLIAKAVGIKKSICPSVIDATAGFGRDAFVLASLGCTVTLLERQPLIAILLDDALQRARKEPDLQTVTARMQLFHGHAIDYLHQLGSAQQPDVIYLDPMYPERSKSAQVKKDMQLLHQLVGQDDDSALLLTLACEKARKRVVVKRPRTAGPVGDLTPSLSLASRHTRYDIYLC